MDIIDAHTHVVSTDLARYPIAPGVADEQGWHREHPVDTEGLLARAEAAGVRGVALVQAISCHGFDNRYVLDSARAYPGRAIAVGAVRVDDERAPEHVARDVREHGMHGVRVMAATVDDPIDTDGARRVVRAAADHDIPVVLLAIARQMPSVPSLVRAFPDVTFVLDHCGFVGLTGGPTFPHASELFALAEEPNVVPKVSSITLQSTEHPAALWAALVARFGAARLLWGSDHPHTHEPDYAGLVDLARRTTTLLPEADRRLVLGGTARQVWPAFT